MKKVKHALNADKFITKGQVNNEPSKTVPDQSMTLRELLVRYAKGLPLEGQKNPIWEGEEGFDIDTQKLDLAEIEELKQKAEEELKDIGERIKEEVKEKNKKKTNKEDNKDEKEQNN